MTGAIAANYKKNKLDALVCIGGGGTHKNALRLVEKGLNILSIPKTIDNDVALTDATIGFDTALGIATEAIDRLHSTAHSHHRIVIAEIMGHAAGWLTLGAGIAGGADVILLPEIPYDVEKTAAAIRRRSQLGTNFSIVAVAEGAKSQEDSALFAEADKRKKNAKTQAEKDYARLRLAELESKHEGNTLAAGETSRGANAPRGARDDPRLRATRWHALVQRSTAGHAPRHRLCRFDCPRREGRDGRGPRRRDKARADQGRGRSPQAGAAGPFLDHLRPPRRHLPGRLNAETEVEPLIFAN